MMDKPSSKKKFGLDREVFAREEMFLKMGVDWPRGGDQGRNFAAGHCGTTGVGSEAGSPSDWVGLGLLSVLFILSASRWAALRVASVWSLI